MSLAGDGRCVERGMVSLSQNNHIARTGTSPWDGGSWGGAWVWGMEVGRSVCSRCRGRCAGVERGGGGNEGQEGLRGEKRRGRRAGKEEGLGEKGGEIGCRGEGGWVAGESGWWGTEEGGGESGRAVLRCKGDEVPWSSPRRLSHPPSSSW